MKTIQVELKGVSPLIMHSCRSVTEVRRLTGKHHPMEAALSQSKEER